MNIDNSLLERIAIALEAIASHYTECENQAICLHTMAPPKEQPHGQD